MSEASIARKRALCDMCTTKAAKEGGELLMCSRCRTAYYCSRECQVQHFPDHKVSCKRQRELQRIMEQKMLSTPASAQTAQDFREFLDVVNQDLIQCARTPLRLGRPYAINHSHILELHFWHDHKLDPTRKNLKARFRFSKGEVLSYAKMERKFGPAAQTGMQTEAQMAKRKHETGPYACISLILLMVDERTMDRAPIFVPRNNFVLASFTGLKGSAVLRIPLNTRWEDTLATLLDPARSESWPPDLPACIALDVLWAASLPDAQKLLATPGGYTPEQARVFFDALEHPTRRRSMEWAANCSWKPQK